MGSTTYKGKKTNECRFFYGKKIFHEQRNNISPLSSFKPIYYTKNTHNTKRLTPGLIKKHFVDDI